MIDREAVPDEAVPDEDLPTSDVLHGDASDNAPTDETEAEEAATDGPAPAPLSDYGSVLAILDECTDVPGDVLEIGALTGAGSRLLGSWTAAHDRALLVIDVFDPDTDTTRNTADQAMIDIYHDVLGDEPNWELFARNTSDVQRMIVYRMSSRDVVLPLGQRLCLAFIDGSHVYDDVRHDAALAWEALSPGGWCGFDDYNHDLPPVHQAVDDFLDTVSEHVGEIRDIGVQRFVRRRLAPA